MRTVQVTGKTIEDAVAEGIAQLGITREEAVVRVIEEPSSGLFGLLRKKPAVVEVSAPEEEAAETALAAEAYTASGSEQKEAEEAAAAPAVPSDAAEETVGEEEKEEKEEFVFSEEEQQETAEEAKKFLEGIFRSMDMKVTMEKMINRDRILLNLHGKGLGVLIGKHGQTLNSLQYLTNLAAGKLYHHRYFVMLDVENYRIRREQTLTALARRLADKAKRTGEKVELEPMDPGERRIIHLALQDDPDIRTDSEGEGSARHVIIMAK